MDQGLKAHAVCGVRATAVSHLTVLSQGEQTEEEALLVLCMSSHPSVSTTKTCLSVCL